MSLRSVCCLALVMAGCAAPAKPAKPQPEIAITPVGTPTDVASQKLIDGSGGAITSADGRLTIAIPAGALSAAQTITVQPITNEAPGGLGSAYRLGPEGQSFAKPVTISFHIADGGNARPGFQDAERHWQLYRDEAIVRTAASETVTVESTHFSDWSYVQGMILSPGQATVDVGKTLELVVMDCQPPSPSPGSSGGGQTTIAFKCATNEALRVDQWSVNGEPFGTAASGLLTPHGGSAATYTAPNTRPPRNPVAVSAIVVDDTSKARTILVSNITVGGHRFSGTVRLMETLPDRTTTSVTHGLVLELAPDGNYRPIEGSVAATIELRALSGIDPPVACMSDVSGEVKLTGNDAELLVDQDGTYVFIGGSTADMVGTTDCNEQHETRPFSGPFPFAWWVNPVPQDEYRVKPDGSLDEKVMTDTLDCEWKLVPVP